MSRTFCIDCEREIDLGAKPEAGEKIRCPYCRTRLEIISVDPLRLDWVYDGPVTRQNPFGKEWGIQP